ncbi:PASTA domain-containing protein [Streptomyces sp. CG1]|uniref:PASTA domain-containing protein n=1 Tax=Streptomyces sp. CG1 TaxID=1287523 RepID=UPI0034E1D4E0
MAVLLAAAACIYVITGSRAPARPRVAAPWLMGETMSEARSSAQAVGVRVQPVRHRVCPHPGTPVGRVCEQTPSPGSQVPCLVSALTSHFFLQLPYVAFQG